MWLFLIEQKGFYCKKKKKKVELCCLSAILHDKNIMDKERETVGRHERTGLEVILEVFKHNNLMQIHSNKFSGCKM